MTNEEKPCIGFGIVGCGMIADFHARALCSVSGARLIGATDVSLARAQAFAQRHGVRAYENFKRMLADDAVDAVCICAPSGYHAALAREALLSGKHVAVEKPIAMTVREADEMIGTARKSGRLLTVLSQFRFAPDTVILKSALEKGRLGKIRICNLSMKYWREESYYSDSPWKGSRLLDGGVLMNQGIHGVDLLNYLVGGASVIGSVTDRLCHPIESPDTALALLRFDCGALGTLEATTAAYPGFDLKLEIIGEKGYAVFSGERLISLCVEGKEEIAECPSSIQGTASDPAAVGWQNHALQLGNFVSAIRGEASLAVQAEDGRAAVALISDIYRE